MGGVIVVGGIVLVLCFAAVAGSISGSHKRVMTEICQDKGLEYHSRGDICITRRGK